MNVKNVVLKESELIRRYVDERQSPGACFSVVIYMTCPRSPCKWENETLLSWSRAVAGRCIPVCTGTACHLSGAEQQSRRRLAQREQQ